MKAIREVYPDQGEEPFYGPGNYDPLLQSMGYEIVLQVDDSDYQGDTRVLFKDGDKYGLLIFGWGSCSGCDSLQACSTYRELEELRQELWQQIRWDTAGLLLSYVTNKDWETEWSWHASETREFVDKAIAYLQDKAKGHSPMLGNQPKRSGNEPSLSNQ